LNEKRYDEEVRRLTDDTNKDDADIDVSALDAQCDALPTSPALYDKYATDDVVM
jgi:hypothetical protein